MAQPQLQGGTPHAQPIPRTLVAVHYAGYRIGLYRVRDVSRDSLLLRHGGISFPVGTELVIEPVEPLAADAGARRPARVIRNDGQGMALAW